MSLRKPNHSIFVLRKKFINSDPSMHKSKMDALVKQIRVHNFFQFISILQLFPQPQKIKNVKQKERVFCFINSITKIETERQNQK